jgi:DNA-binding winged helix-turn-helix (wHTH) protein
MIAISFDVYSLDPVNFGVWNKRERIAKYTPLTPRLFTLLSYLVTYPGRLLTKQELLHAVWPGTIVSDACPTVAIHDVRKILGHHFIETVHRRGYRFRVPTKAKRAPTPMVF